VFLEECRIDRAKILKEWGIRECPKWSISSDGKPDLLHASLPRACRNDADGLQPRGLSTSSETGSDRISNSMVMLIAGRGARDDDMASDREGQRVIGFRTPHALGLLHTSVSSADSSAVAIRSEVGTWTYAELHARSNQLAHHLQALGVGPDVVVGLFLDRSPEFLVAILGVLKAGGTFLPLDLKAPRQRVSYMIDETGASIVITREAAAAPLAGLPFRRLCVDRDARLIADRPSTDPNVSVEPDNLAYLLYTSGSTGRPKAVAMTHRGIVDHVEFAKRLCSYTSADRVLQFSPATSDGSIQEIFCAWAAGATVVLPHGSVPGLLSFMEILTKHRISVVSLPTAYWHFWVREMSITPVDWPDSIRLVNIGGERVIPELFVQWQGLAHTRDVVWINDYGPTEAAVSCTNYRAAPGDGDVDLCIGRPNINVEAYVLDHNGRQVEPGAAGELFVGGPGLARGYYARPGLTAERFVPNPFGIAGSRLYRTGDQVRYRHDGNLEFLGRVDDQVKVMGYRVELGEVEGALLRCAGVRLGAVSVHEGPDGPQIDAHVVAEGFDETRIRQELSELLPLAAMPRLIIRVLALPLTHNGKIDRLRLADAAIAATCKRREAAVPLSFGDLEDAVARIWEDVTGRAPTSIDEDFLLVGGDSLRAIRLVGRLARSTGIDPGIPAFLRGRTIRSLAATLMEGSIDRDIDASTLAARIRSDAGHAAILRRNSAKRRLASNAQMRLWVLDRMQDGAPTYSVPLAYKIDGPLSLERLDRALTIIVERHEALRTELVLGAADVLEQVVVPPRKVETELRHVRNLGEALAIASVEAAKPLRLDRSPLLRSLCIRTGDHEHLWLLVLHHAATDAWSIGLLWRELAALYDGEVHLLKPPFQYADYADWQREWLSSAAAERQKEFWRDRLSGELPLLQLKRRQSEEASSEIGSIEKCPFGLDLTSAVENAAAQLGTTPVVVLLSAFAATLHRITRQDQILIGVPVACRTLPETADVFGFFANTLPLRLFLEPRTSFADLVSQTAAALSEALQHQDLPFDEIVDALGITRQDGVNPIFQAMLAIQTISSDGDPHLPGVSVREVVVHSGTAKVDVTCSIRNTAQGLEGEIEYSADALEPHEGRRLVSGFLNLLASAVRDPEHHVGTLAMLSDKEACALIQRANENFERYGDASPVHLVIEEQIARTPDAVAIEHRGKALSYAELNIRANRLARHLATAGAGPESLVGICMDRSVAMVVAVLATLKAGAGFVPLDPRFPAGRIAAIANDAALVAIVTDSTRCPALASVGCTLIVEDDADGAEGSDLSVAVSIANIAYAYYTSGSTGKPKGVILEHRTAMLRLEWLRRRYPLSVGDRLLHKTPLIFDVAIWEIFGPLMAGATILLADQGAEADVREIASLLAMPNTVFTHFVPSMLEAYLDATRAQIPYPKLRWVALSGEAAASRLLHRYNRHFSSEFHNWYGQTETSEVTSWEGTTPTAASVVPIGKQIGAYRVYVLDSDLKPVPPGVPGEICVAGIDGLARGYLGKPALTAEKFVPNPYAVIPGERMYRTGDLARMLEDQTIEFVGRIDHQVKVAGCRVETEEVEAILNEHPSVRKCVVIAREASPGNTQLVAYLLGIDASSSTLREHVQRQLPQYMVPSAFVFLDQFPMTASGKLDRNHLPAPTEADLAVDADAPLPQGAVEREVAAIWQAVLKLGRIGRDESFFVAGGNSLKAIQVLARVEETFGVSLRVSRFWSAPTVGGLAKAIEEASAGTDDASPQNGGGWREPGAQCPTLLTGLLPSGAGPQVSCRSSESNRPAGATLPPEWV
jgi:amino acid adenylation domain-containing protein